MVSTGVMKSLMFSLFSASVIYNRDGDSRSMNNIVICSSNIVKSKYFLELINKFSRYFLSNIQRITAPTFVPESRDILQVRVKTTGVIEYNFPTEGGKEFIMVSLAISANYANFHRKPKRLSVIIFVGKCPSLKATYCF